MSDAILEVDFGFPLGKRSFQSHQELLVWWEKERTFWNRILNDKAAQSAGDIRSFLTQPLNQCDRTLREGAQPWTSESSPNQTDALKNWMRNAKSVLEGHYLNGTLFLADSPKGQFLSGYFEKRGALAAVYAASFLLRLGHMNQSYLKQEAEFAAFCFQEGLANRADAEISALKQAEAEWQESRRIHGEEMKALKGEAAEWGEKQGALLNAFREDTKTLKGGFDTMMKDADGDLARIKATYDRKLALHAPVLYWRAKSFRHGRAATQIGRWTLSAVVASTALLMWVAYEFLVSPIHKQPNWKPELGNFFAVVLIGSVLVWLMRELVKLWLSEVHLRHDAQFRIALLRTYLSLLKGEKGIGDKDQSALVAALYRPTPDGVVKEDTTPASLLDFIAQRLK
ncbi:MAG: hypothetical protein FD161_3722 [Limisphaerales bacterium]|nr:MAG: hypothetical protein FD161_3722 [Limisphaerales bacterium]KAG0507528.1 MAG: hypothetical protein E1N63_3319 [Limisphaerales bacterium]TXT48972.1 MAG: hypothetical protein FD140_3354 [Limisphaerales bacterium]